MQHHVHVIEEVEVEVLHLQIQLAAVLAAQSHAVDVVPAEHPDRRFAIAAQRGAGDEFGKANEVLQERTTGSDVCRAASDAFDAELRKERAK